MSSAMHNSTPKHATSKKPLPPPKPDLSYYIRRPESKLATLIWRWRIRFEASFAITVLEPWEKVVVMTFLALVFTLIIVGIIKFVPQQLLTMQGRAAYYIWGHETDPQHAGRFWPGLSASSASMKDG